MPPREEAAYDAGVRAVLDMARIVAAMAIIADTPGDQGEIPCPECSGRFRWIRDSTNRHIHGQCEGGCLTVMQ